MPERGQVKKPAVPKVKIVWTLPILRTRARHSYYVRIDVVHYSLYKNDTKPISDRSNLLFVVCTATTPPSAFDKPVYVSLSDAIGLMMMMCALIMLIVGFAAGFIFSRYFRHNAFPLPLHPFHPHNRLADMNGTVEIGTDYVPNNKEPFSFLKNMTKDKNDCTLEKNLDTSVENKTLQKVKKTYI